MAKGDKHDFPVDQTRRFMEPGPIVLVSSAYKSERNIMTMGWHMMMEYNLIGCYIWTRDHSRMLIEKSGECVFNIPDVSLAPTVVKIGNSTGTEIDKFATYGLTAEDGDEVGAPLIRECFANFECRLVDRSLIRKYSVFVFEVVKAHAAPSPKFPKTIHYRGDGRFMISGEETARWRRLFKPEMLEG